VIETLNKDETELGMTARIVHNTIEADGHIQVLIPYKL
jgi:hypothetical protein